MNDIGWNGDGCWVGPRDLRAFLRRNRFYVAFNFVVITGIALAFLFDAAKISTWVLAFPLAVLAGAIATLCVMFAFSRGWITDGG